MKRRALCLLLSLIMIFSLCSVNTLAANDYTQQTVEYAPYAVLDFVQEVTSVTVGHVRVITQTSTNKKYNAAYYTSKGGGGECSTTCLSMALSYLGTDLTPKQLLEGYDGVHTKFNLRWNNVYYYGNETTFEEMMERYTHPGSGLYSPPIIEMGNYSYAGGSHYVLVVAQKSGYNYIAVDPANGLTMDITIEPTGSGYKLTYSKCATGSETISASNNKDWWQYYDPNASLSGSSSGSDSGVTPTETHVHNYFLTAIQADGQNCTMTCQNSGCSSTEKNITRTFSKEEILKMKKDSKIKIEDTVQEMALESGRIADPTNFTAEIGAADITMLARHLSKISEITAIIPYINADRNSDGEINSTDLTDLAKYAASKS